MPNVLNKRVVMQKLLGWRTMRNVLLLLCLTIATITSGCATNGRGGNYCDIAKPIYMTDAPIDRSVERSIIIHNETWQHICGKQ